MSNCVCVSQVGWIGHQAGQALPTTSNAVTHLSFETNEIMEQMIWRLTRKAKIKDLPGAEGAQGFFDRPVLTLLNSTMRVAFPQTGSGA